MNDLKVSSELFKQDCILVTITNGRVMLLPLYLYVLAAKGKF